MGMDCIISFILILFLMLFRVPLFKLFTQDPAVIRIGSDMLALITPCYIFFVFIEVLAGALRGMGDVMIPTLITLLGVCVLRLIWVAIVLKVSPTINAIIYSYPVTWIATAILFIIYYLYKK